MPEGLDVRRYLFELAVVPREALRQAHGHDLLHAVVE
jgi:hypothetical protein